MRERERKIVREQEEGHRVLYLTRRLLQPVTWYNLKGDAASHLPLCKEMNSINNDGSHFHMAICLNQLAKCFTLSIAYYFQNISGSIHNMGQK